MNTLDNYRDQIDDIDNQIVVLLAKRFDLVKGIALLKKQQNISPLQPNRWKEILDSKKKLAKKHGISQDFIVSVWNMIHQYSLNIQMDIK